MTRSEDGVTLITPIRTFSSSLFYKYVQTAPKDTLSLGYKPCIPSIHPNTSARYSLSMVTDLQSVTTNKTWPYRFLVAVVVLLSITLLALQALFKDHISGVVEYDDGVYMLASLQVLHGLRPYKDFVFLQPPLITLWLTPASTLALDYGTKTAFEAARILTDLVTLFNVLALARLLKGKSPIGAVVGVAAYALSFTTIQASQSVLIEPYLDLLCLLALNFFFEKGQLTTSTSRTGIGALIFGLAGATKVWAFLPFIVLVFLVSKKNLKLLPPFLVGTSIGFIGSVLPFTGLNPINMIKQTLFDQGVRGFSGEGLASRLANLSGVGWLSVIAHDEPFIGLLLELLVSVLALYLLQRSRQRSPKTQATPLHTYALASTVVIAITLFVAPPFYYHYGAFLSPFVGMLIGSSNLMVSTQKDITRTLRRSRQPALLLTAGAALMTLLSGDVFVAIHPPNGTTLIPKSFVSMIRDSRCVLTNEPSLVLLAGAVTSYKNSCPHVVDWNGTERNYTNGISGEPANASNTSLQRLIIHWLKRSNTIAFSTIDKGLGTSAQMYLRTHFRATYFRHLGVTLYQRTTKTRSLASSQRTPT